MSPCLLEYLPIFFPYNSKHTKFIINDWPRQPFTIQTLVSLLIKLFLVPHNRHMHNNVHLTLPSQGRWSQRIIHFQREILFASFLPQNTEMTPISRPVPWTELLMWGYRTLARVRVQRELFQSQIFITSVEAHGTFGDVGDKVGGRGHVWMHPYTSGFPRHRCVVELAFIQVTGGFGSTAVIRKSMNWFK